MRPQAHPVQAPHFTLSRTVLAALAAAATTIGPVALAQQPALAPAAATTASTAALPSTTLPPVTVSASVLAVSSDEMSTPVNLLVGEGLRLKREASLGETLATEPGIHASHFGGGASRPVIRGMDAARVKVLSDGSEVQDASTISPDHAVALEPLLARQIEVLRGPSALAYGGGAIGGVVNVLDNKIPTERPARGIEGSVELRANSAAREGAGAFELSAGLGEHLVLHAEGVKRDANSYRVGSGWAGGRRVDGSYNQTETGSLGLSWVGTQGFLGLAYTEQRSTYGLAGHQHSLEGCHPHGDQLHCGSHEEEGHAHEGEEEVHDHAAAGDAAVPLVRLQSQRWDLRGEWREPFAGVSALRLRAGVTDYQHNEVEEGSVATTFKNQAHDLRLELLHQPLAGWRGVLGLQTSQRDFSALGEEAYVLPTSTHKQALFLVEHTTVGDWRFEAAARHERQRVDVDDATRPDASHSGSSLSAGAVWRFAPQYSLGLSLSQAHRLPSAEELYADGLHLATATYERGNAALRRETSRNIDLTLRKTEGDTRFSATVFHNRIRDYIYARTVDELDRLQLVDYSQQDARFTGLEAQLHQRINAHLGVGVFGDLVRARLDTGGSLPRIPARRLGLRLDSRWASWQAQAELVRVDRQDHIAAFETATPGYTLLNLSLQYNTRINGLPVDFYVKGNNLGNQLAFVHTSFTKDTVPLMGRNITAGMRVSF